MQKRRLAALFCAVAIAIVLPTIALAATNPTGAGLVPCGVGSDPLVATECEACNVVQLVQNVIMFLIGLAIPIAMVMFTWAGILYFTSGAGGGNENISKAKRIFSSSLFGFVLALAAWLIVNTILYTVLDHDKYPNSSWFHVDCSVIDRLRTETIGNVIAKNLGIAPEVVPMATGQFNTLGCQPGQTLKSSPAGSYCENPDGTTSGLVAIQAPTGVGGVGYCSAANLASTFGSNAGTMSCILQAESSCNPVASGDSNFSIGLAQINMSANNVTCNGQTYLCRDAFSDSYSCGEDGKGPCGSYVNKIYVGPVTIKNPALAQTCRDMLKNPVCNLETAKKLVASEGFGIWSTYKKKCQ